MKRIVILLVLFVTALSFTGCSKPDPLQEGFDYVASYTLTAPPPQLDFDDTKGLLLVCIVVNDILDTEDTLYEYYGNIKDFYKSHGTGAYYWEEYEILASEPERYMDDCSLNSLCDYASYCDSVYGISDQTRQCFRYLYGCYELLEDCTYTLSDMCLNLCSDNISEEDYRETISLMKEYKDTSKEASEKAYYYYNTLFDWCTESEYD